MTKYNMKLRFKTSVILLIFVIILCSGLTNCDEPEEGWQLTLPGYLPIEIARTDVGEPVSHEEVVEFTKRLTGAWKNSGYIEWLDRMTYGLPEDNEFGEPFYDVLWAQTIPTKEGDTVTFVHRDGHGADNITQIQVIILANLVAGYYLTGDDRMAQVANGLSRGLNAFFMGMEWDDQVPEDEKYIMARYIVNKNFVEDMGDGRTRAADYTYWREAFESDGFSEMIYIENNPYWGDIYVKAKRSKDDVFFMIREQGLMTHFRDVFSNSDYNESYNTYLDYMEGFARDIVDNGYRIRTRDQDGSIYTPDGDFNSFIYFGEEVECPIRMALDLIGYDTTLTTYACGNGIVEWFEEISVESNEYMRSMNRAVHMSGIVHALNHGLYDIAAELLKGYITRTEIDVAGIEIETDVNLSWENCKTYNEELAGEIVKAASVGLPLTSQEVAFIHVQYDKAIDVWNDWEWWDLWDASLPDGEYVRQYFSSWDYYPYSLISFEEMTNFMQYCASPYLNRNSAELVDCSIISDIDSWGE